MTTSSARTRGDLCPGVLRPWAADDGLLVRLRLVGGKLTGSQLDAVLTVSEQFGDGAVHLTGRANLQVRGLAGDGCLTQDAVAAFESSGLLPSRTHELARNILVSPLSGYAAGYADLRPIAAELDRLLMGDPALGSLPGRFLFVLDAGSGDLLGAPADLGLVALPGERCQLRIGDGWGPVVALEDAAAALVDLAREFLQIRGHGATAAWHVRELASSGDSPIFRTVAPTLDVPATSDPLPYGRADGGAHVAVPDGVLTRSSAEQFVREHTLIVTPWRGIFVPLQGSSHD